VGRVGLVAARGRHRGRVQGPARGRGGSRRAARGDRRAPRTRARSVQDRGGVPRRGHRGSARDAPAPVRVREPRGAATRSRRRADAPFEVPESEYTELEYMDWKSGGDTNFAPIATADGKLDCRGFWNDGDERPDKDAILTSNALRCPTIATYVESVGVNFGRV